MNSLLDLIRQSKSDEELKEIIDFHIEEFTKKARVDNSVNYIGVNADINPQYNIVYDMDDLLGDLSPSNSRWIGYIPSDVKVSYKTVTNKGVTHNECFYYMGDESYLYEFAKFIRDKKVSEDLSFIIHVHDFVHQYFDCEIDSVKREKFHSLLFDKDGKRVLPTKKRVLSELKGLGAALCTEYTVMGQNIMTLFGLKTEVICDKGHVYNVYFDDNGEINIVDFQHIINMYDVNQKFLRTLPFIETILDCDEKKYKLMLLGLERFNFDNYFVVDFLEDVLPIMDGNERSYGCMGIDVTKYLNRDQIKMLLKKQ